MEGERFQFSSVTQSWQILCSSMDCSHASVPCPSPTPRACSDSCPLSQWRHPTISSSVIPFSSHLQSSQRLALFQWFCSLYQVAKYWSFSFSINPSNEHSGLITFRMDWLDLLAVQETLRRLHHHSSKASVLWHSAFFMVQISHPYMTTGKSIDLTRWTFVGKVMSLLFNTLSVCHCFSSKRQKYLSQK